MNSIRTRTASPDQHFGAVEELSCMQQAYEHYKLYSKNYRADVEKKQL